MRRVETLVAYSGCYEFEDVIATVTGADRIDVDHIEAMTLSRRLYRLARFATGSRRLARTLSIRPHQVALTRDYELFFPVFNYPHELYALSTIPNWRERCRVAACFLCEVFVDLLPDYLLELLGEFDHVFVGSKTAAESVAKAVGRPCTYLPFACDVLKFAPLPNRPARTIDVCNIGRRSDITHDALMALARERRIFYYYDTVAASGAGLKQRTFRVQVPSEHRFLLANLLQRTRYYIANRSRANEPHLPKERQEISGRFYEGAAAGAVLVGEPPQCAEFEEQFCWPDSTIRVPFDYDAIGDVLADLDRDPERLARIRGNNVHYAALKHDWVHRVWKAFDILGVSPTLGMQARDEELRGLAATALEYAKEV